ncbi:MAG: metallophosphoesterase family protein [Pseudonocardia sp.]|nr:metallophosphoesterase family protein [Pseudonocardia sp.]
MTQRLNPPGETPNVGVPVELASAMCIGEQRDWVRAFLRARPISRRSALRGAAGALAGLGLVSAAACGGPSGAPPTGPATGGAVQLTGRRLSFGADARTEMAIAAELTGKPTGTILVDLGTGTDYGRTLEAEVRHLVSMVPQEDGSIRSADQFFVHGLANQLSPGQRYHYRFRLPDGTTTADAVFSTAPEASARVPFTFTAFGDQGVNTDPTDHQLGFSDNYYKPDDTRRTQTPANTMVGLITKRNPAFHLLAGDICYADPSGTGEPIRNDAPKDADNGFNNFDPTTWTTYFATIETSASTTPWMFATGNHDMEAIYDDNKAPGGATHGYGGHAARLDLPKSGPSNCPSVYSFRYGNVGLLSLDANDLSTEIRTNAGYSNGSQTAWVRQTLSTLRADPTIDFIVAFFHHCAYATSKSHASDFGVRNAWAPLFEEFTVDLVVQGHNHQYERTNPIKAGRSAAQAPDGSTVRPETDGTTYICVGSGGRPRYSWQPNVTDRYRGFAGPDSGTHVVSFINAADGSKQPETIDWSQARYLDYAFLQVDVVPAPAGGESKMTVRAISDTGQEIDAVTLLRRTRGTVAKPTAADGWYQRPSGLSVPA